VSRWPVAGGVVVEDGVLYAAAGIAHYDTNHVVALDAASGEVKWYNSSSGTVSSKVNCGISLQGNLHLGDGELRFLGGGAYQVARYDRETGKCLNAPHDGLNSRFQTAFHPYYPRYGQYLSLHRTYPDGKTLSYNASYEGSQHSQLALLAPPRPGAGQPERSDRRTDRPRRAPQRRAIWQMGGRFNSFAVGPDALLAAGQTGPEDNSQAFLAAVRIRDGSTIWRRELPAAVVKGGTAVDGGGRIVAALETGQVLCFAGAE
jgi:outer membrane protein assembly factor BamB